ncbi:MAG: glutathionylspermidine synthase family protein, partial [Rhodospirillales bacterium]|nr:glutathionylspermidine synthase family protein [Rhodospirillales bacterium]
EPFARFISGQATQWIEPPWTMILAGKGLLPVLWEMHPGHPLLLPAWFADDPRAGRAGMPLVAAAPRGLGSLVVHASPSLPEAGGGGHAVAGLWMVAGRPAGLAVREISRDGHTVTVPHGVV